MVFCARRLAVTLAVVGLLATACSGNSSRSTEAHSGSATGHPGPAAKANAPSAAPASLPALHAVRGAHPMIVDAEGRQVLLRGVDVNSLGEYAAANPNYPHTTVPLTGKDWDRMAAEGFTGVRLLVSWSRLEPKPGQIDTHYIETIRHQVQAGAARGIYSVIDMHQDAWGVAVGTPKGTTCPAGTTAAIGWDGAPAWATPKAGADSCRGGSREDSELEHDAWDRFYADAGGVQTHLVQVWGAVAKALAAELGVGGYDLLNEPNPGRDTNQSLVRLAQFYRRSIAAIRAGERAAGSIAKPIFFEYTVDDQAVAANFSTDPGLVFAPHIYGGSIAPISVDQNWDYAESLAKGYDTAIWVGEYGWFTDDPDSVLPKVRRYGQREDQAIAGGAWWQWRQACGDPHSIGAPDGRPAKVIDEYQDNGCPGDHDLGVVPQWHRVVSRPFPRAAPGRLLSLTSDGKARTLHLTGTDARSNVVLEVWVPGTAKPKASATGLGTITETKVAGGWDLTAPATARDYSFTVG